MNYDMKIIVMAFKGTPPPEPDCPAAFAVCTACKRELVYDARNRAKMEEDGLVPYCGPCGADLVLRSGVPTAATITGIYKGKPCARGVEEFLEEIEKQAGEKIQ